MERFDDNTVEEAAKELYIRPSVICPRMFVRRSKKLNKYWTVRI